MRITARGSVRALVVAAVVLIVGCERGDRRLNSLTVGISKDSASAVMGGVAPKRTDPYLYQGQYIETMFYPRLGKTNPEDLEDRRMSPLVVINGTLVGWGWNFWDSVASANGIPVAKPK
ncbi:MAG: hypothetical protein KF785_15685 [Gemmatimonadales bacterium]|nr:hypothetical protein [Gemmatimonadales bacterium]